MSMLGGLIMELNELNLEYQKLKERIGELWRLL